MAVTPPLRGPDENAHFLRAYGLARGDIIPLAQDDKGRKGLFLPDRLASEFAFFDAAREGAASAGFSYRRVFGTYSEQRFQERLPRGRTGAVFVPYGGSEGYTPVAYIPYAAAAGVAALANLDFLPTLYLMRLAGLLATTAIIAYAIARTPVLRWCFFAVAMLPSAMLGRSLVNADGAVLASTLVVIALCLDAAAKGNTHPIQRAVWMTLCALTKPSQVVFALLELVTGAFPRGWRGWASAAAIMIPGIALSALWVLAAGTDIGVWRLSEGGSLPAEQFQAAWKFRYMLEHPLHFPAALLTSLDYSAELWRQLIGVLGWLDTRLHPLAYPVLTVLLIVGSLDRIDLPQASRRRVVITAAVTSLAYWLLVFALLFVTSTPVTSDRVLGVQGRYFIVMLPLMALVVAALNPRRPSTMLQAGATIVLALISVVVVVEAVLRTDWS